MKKCLIVLIGATLLAATAQAAPVDRGLQGGSYNAGKGGFNVGGQGGSGGGGRLQNDGGQEMGGGRSSYPGKTNQGGYVSGDNGGHSPGSKGWQ